MDTLSLITRGTIAGGDITLASKGFITGGFGFWPEVWKEIINLVSRIQLIFELKSKLW